jgi:hypothetical protein
MAWVGILREFISLDLAAHWIVNILFKAMHTAIWGLDFVVSITPFLCLVRWSPGLENVFNYKALSFGALHDVFLSSPAPLPPARSFQPILILTRTLPVTTQVLFSLEITVLMIHDCSTGLLILTDPSAMITPISISIPPTLIVCLYGAHTYRGTRSDANSGEELRARALSAPAVQPPLPPAVSILQNPASSIKPPGPAQSMQG